MAAPGRSPLLQLPSWRVSAAGHGLASGSSGAGLLLRCGTNRRRPGRGRRATYSGIRAQGPLRGGKARRCGHGSAGAVCRALRCALPSLRSPSLPRLQRRSLGDEVRPVQEIVCVYSKAQRYNAPNPGPGLATRRYYDRAPTFDGTAPPPSGRSNRTRRVAAASPRQTCVTSICHHQPPAASRARASGIERSRGFRASAGVGGKRWAAVRVPLMHVPRGCLGVLLSPAAARQRGSVAWPALLAQPRVSPWPVRCFEVPPWHQHPSRRALLAIPRPRRMSAPNRSCSSAFARRRRVRALHLRTGGRRHPCCCAGAGPELPPCNAPVAARQARCRAFAEPCVLRAGRNPRQGHQSQHSARGAADHRRASATGRHRCCWLQGGRHRRAWALAGTPPAPGTRQHIAAARPLPG